MLSRRRWLAGAAISGATAPLLAACSSATSGTDEAARRLRAPFAAKTGDRDSLLRELVRYATLAPSSHNTQCWQFRLGERAIAIAPDLSRRCPVVDPDDHHLFVSLGCATENLAQAALANGLQVEARFDPAGPGSVVASLVPTRAVASPLFGAITERQCTRGDYDGQPLSAQELGLLERAGSAAGVRVLMLTERPALEKVLGFVTAGNTSQMSDPAFLEELKAWIRFSADEATRTGDGLYAGASGNPSMPRWLGSPLLDVFFTVRTENERYARQIRNSAGIAVFVAETADAAHWVEVGRCYERFALQATALGIRNAFVNQPVEVAALRPQFASALGLGALRPDLVVRFGRGPATPWAMRRPVQAVVV
ncbi:MAG TPA: Tat pathway signal protein [Ideonella sp.]|nr:Tat pathway signal protein [Ideonella sp.]